MRRVRLEPGHGKLQGQLVVWTVLVDDLQGLIYRVADEHGPSKDHLRDVASRRILGHIRVDEGGLRKGRWRLWRRSLVVHTGERRMVRSWRCCRRLRSRIQRWWRSASHSREFGVIEGTFATTSLGRCDSGAVGGTRHPYRRRRWRERLHVFVVWSVRDRYMDPPRTTGRLANPDISEWSVEVALTVLSPSLGGVILYSCLCCHRDSRGPVLDSLVGGSFNFALPSLSVLFLFGKHRLVKLAQALDHADDVTVLRIELSDLILAVLVSP